MNLGQNQGLERGSSSRRKCIITAVKARLAEEQNMHQVSMALHAFFVRKRNENISELTEEAADNTVVEKDYFRQGKQHRNTKRNSNF